MFHFSYKLFSIIFYNIVFLFRTIVTAEMMKKILIFICVLATIGSIFAIDCKLDERCCLRTRFHPGCRRCCKAGERDDMSEMNGMKQRDDPDWTRPVKRKASEHCCRKSAAGGCAKCFRDYYDFITTSLLMSS